MSLLKTALFGLSAAFMVTLAYGTLDENCLGCLCQASTGCQNIGGCPRGYCGPFLISRAYWIDAGKPVFSNHAHNPDAPGAFESCAADLACAADIVRAYMAKYGNQDCNGDGFVSCTDFVKIHKLGRNACGNHLQQGEFVSAYENCRHNFNLV
ncbi:Lysozyme 1-like [Homarus americanus]|uniref:lysozyme n=1 Tax=Homarus americanus TaxID=6706 RepID=A0A8J5MNV9_HOMAM|nr:Lysozyme 1-like [Homarus americanus]